MKSKTIRILIAGALSLSLILSTTLIAFAALPEYGEEYTSQPSKSYNQTFTDVDKSYWAFEYISEMAERGVLSGYPNGYFYPNNTITRAEFAKVMCLAASITVTPVSATSYIDVFADEWFAPYVEAGKYYLSGYVSDGSKYYMPNDNALREDIAVALVKLKGYDTSIYDESILKAMFTDYLSISQGARKYVAVAVEQGLISGYGDNTFKGQNTITRAEAATLLWRAYQYGSGNKVFEKEDLEPVKPVETPAPTSKPDEEQKLELTLNVDKTNFNIEAGDTVEFTVTVGFNFLSQSGFSTETPRVGYIPDIDGDIDIINAIFGDSRELGENKTISKYSTKKLKAGKYALNLSIQDEYTTHEKIITINVIEPEPEYLYELKTIASGISKVDGMVATDEGIIYLADNKIMEVKKDANKATVLFEASNVGYLGTRELTKSEQANLTSDIHSIGYNQNDGCIYAIVQQDTYKWYVYNTTTKSSLYEMKTTTGYFWDSALASNLSNGHIRTFDFDLRDNLLLRGSTVSEIGIGDVLLRGTEDSKSINGNVYCITNNYSNINVMTKTGKFETLDYYIPGSPKYFAANNKNFYFTSNNELYSVDTNGDSKLLCGIDDIDNVDGKPIRIPNIKVITSAVDNDGVIYYWDIDYQCIRQLEHK